MDNFRDILRPWLEGDEPNAQGEQGMHCPFHPDTTRSASVNFSKGLFYCQVCQQPGITLQDLANFLEENPEITPPETKWTPSKRRGTGVTGELNEGMVRGWHSALLTNPLMLLALRDRRGLNRQTIVDFEVGWDSRQSAYTIPVRNRDGELVNCRFYQMDVPDDRRKIWSIAGRGSPILFPWHDMPGDNDFVVVCEGEWDSMLTRQHGICAVTRTGSATTWKGTWNGEFQGLVVYICHDRDAAGQDGNRLVAASLENVAAEIYIVNLPFELEEKHGKDLTDYWLEGHTAHDFMELLAEAEPWGDLDDSAPVDLRDVTLLESFDAANVGQRLRTQVTITGRQNPTYIIPEKVEFKCDMGAGLKCAHCPMNKENYNGYTTITIDRHDPTILKLIGHTDKQLDDLLRARITPVKCGRLLIGNLASMSVEELFVRPSVENFRNEDNAGDYLARKIISVGKHDTMPNNTVEIVGTIFPSPRTQHNEFQVWSLETTETSVDRFDLTPENVAKMQKFKAATGQSPLQKLGDIAKDLSNHVTQIYGRDTMHAMMDLTFHSVVAYVFDGKIEPRGWLDTIVVGDTRTGKTEAARRLIGYYRAGEYVSCEAATFAGVVGGLQQYGGKEWTVTWGAVPINDRRLVVLDEVSGLTTEQIAQMSSIRSSGEAQLTKIQSERTLARTRLLWLGNPRDGNTMARYTYGSQALRPLIGNNEDVARFDMAMSVATTDVTSTRINQHHGYSEQKYDQESAQLVLQWAWSRKAEHVRWDTGTVQAVYAGAMDMGERYVEDPPLVQAANIRMKITRIAVALAARLFSTPPDDAEIVLVTLEHVQAAIDFLDILYTMPGFGYSERSKFEIKNRVESVRNRDKVRDYVRSHKGLAEFIMAQGGSFRRSDIEDTLAYQKEVANAVSNSLWDLKAVTKTGKVDFMVTPVLHDVVREIIEEETRAK